VNKEEAKELAYGLVKVEIDSAVQREWPFEEGCEVGVDDDDDDDSGSLSDDDKKLVMASLDEILVELEGLEAGTKKIVDI